MTREWGKRHTVTVSTTRVSTKERAAVVEWKLKGIW
jgi:hypothetical protein